MNRVPGDPRRGSCRSALDPHGPPVALVTLNVPNDSQMILSPTNQALSVSRAKRSAPAEEEYGLKQGGLPRSVAAPDQGEPGCDVEVCLLDAADVPDREGGQPGHAGTPWRDRSCARRPPTACHPRMTPPGSHRGVPRGTKPTATARLAGQARRPG